MRELAGETLGVIREAMERQVPLVRLGERREWRERRLAALSAHKREMKRQEEEVAKKAADIEIKE